MRISLAALLVGAVAALSASAAFGHKAVGDCSGPQLAGRFAVIPGSPGAGSISYKLTLRNTSATPCTVTGLPLGQLLGTGKARLSTHVRAAHPGALAAVLVTLLPGDTSFATARFSPDVPGKGEPLMGPCEPKAYWFRVRPPGGGTTTVKVLPPTSVCEHGTMFLSAYSHKG
jgi:uncharacterized protein DUF4232